MGYIALYVKILDAKTKEQAKEEALNNVPFGCMFYAIEKE